MITIEQGQEIIHLTNVVVDMSIKWTTLQCTFEEYTEAKRAMSKYLASLVQVP